MNLVNGNKKIWYPEIFPDHDSYLAETGFRQNNVDGKFTSSCAYYLTHFIFTEHVHINSNYIKVVSVTSYFTHSM